MLNDDISQNLLTLISTIGPVGRRNAMREIAAYLKKANKDRIERNIDPDGNPMVRRKKGTDKMFQKINQKIRSSANDKGASIGFYGRLGYIATNHQLGKELTHQRRDGSTFKFNLPVRELLGLNDTDKQAIQNILKKHLGIGVEA